MAVFDAFDPLANITPRFTEEQLQDLSVWFDENSKPLLTINEREPINVISIETLMDFLKLKKFHRRSFHYPTYAEIMKEAEYLKAGVLRILTKEQFIYVLNQWVLESEVKHELLLAFKVKLDEHLPIYQHLRVFDNEKRDFLEIDEIKSIVTTYADTFDESETREMLRDANVRGDGNVYYKNFVESLFSLAPELYEIKADYLYDNPDEDPSIPSEPVVSEEPSPPPPLPPPPPPPPPTTTPPPADKKGKKKK